MAEILISMIRIFAGIYNNICRRAGAVKSFHSSAVHGHSRYELKNVNFLILGSLLLSKVIT